RRAPYKNVGSYRKPLFPALWLDPYQGEVKLAALAQGSALQNVSPHLLLLAWSRGLESTSANLAAGHWQRQNGGNDCGHVPPSKDSQCPKLSLPACAWRPMP